MRVERIGISNKACWSSAMNYVESLVSTCWKSAIPTRSTFSVHSKEDDSSEEEEGNLLYLDEPSESDYEDEL
ncbi:F-box family protein, partial [Trifolium medium]|nr:F-box family protein [Trifolium medium]